MFYFPGCTPYVIHTVSCKHEGFPHSEIVGLTVARHLPHAYRSHATSFIAILSQGIHHTLLNFPIRKFKNHYTNITNFIECTNEMHHCTHSRYSILFV